MIPSPKATATSRIPRKMKIVIFDDGALGGMTSGAGAGAVVEGNTGGIGASAALAAFCSAIRSLVN